VRAGTGEVQHDIAAHGALGQGLQPRKSEWQYAFARGRRPWQLAGVDAEQIVRRPADEICEGLIGEHDLRFAIEDQQALGQGVEG
jgi:hypothetical protein